MPPVVPARHRAGDILCSLDDSIQCGVKKIGGIFRVARGVVPTLLLRWLLEQPNSLVDLLIGHLTDRSQRFCTLDGALRTLRARLVQTKTTSKVKPMPSQTTAVVGRAYRPAP
jgi:hypothetical protein